MESEQAERRALGGVRLVADMEQVGSSGGGVPPPGRVTLPRDLQVGQVAVNPRPAVASSADHRFPGQNVDQPLQPADRVTWVGDSAERDATGAQRSAAFA